MTSLAQIGGTGFSGAIGFGATTGFGRSTIRDGSEDQGQDARRLPGRSDDAETTALPGRAPLPEPGTANSTNGVPRLPGQESAQQSGPRGPLTAIGAFTLAVAFDLAADASTRSEDLEPATPSTLAEKAGADEEVDDAEAGLDGLTEEEREAVRELQQRDAEVRRHEAAHAAAGGQYAGAPSFTYQTGPDGKRYAVGGEVSIDTTPVKDDPAATIRKAQQIRAAASAPADPSSQDRRVAAQANALQQQAQAELAAERRQEQQAGEAGQTETAQTEAAAAAPTTGAVSAPGVQPTVPDQSGDGSIGAAAGGPEGVAAGRSTGNAGNAEAGPDDPGTDNRGIVYPGADRAGSEDQGPQAAGSDFDDVASGFSEDDEEAARPFASAAFSAAAASYRGPERTASLLSLTV